MAKILRQTHNPYVLDADTHSLTFISLNSILVSFIPPGSCGHTLYLYIACHYALDIVTDKLGKRYTSRYPHIHLHSQNLVSPENSLGVPRIGGFPLPKHIKW